MLLVMDLIILYGVTTVLFNHSHFKFRYFVDKLHGIGIGTDFFDNLLLFKKIQAKVLT